MHIPRRFFCLIVICLALLAGVESRRSGYRLPKIQGRSASDSSPSRQDVGSGRDFMKKFMMMRGLFQQPSDNVIIITNPPSTTTTTTTGNTPTSTTTTTTTTPTSNTTGRSFDDKAEVQEPVPVATMSALEGLEDRLDLPEADPLVVQEVTTHKPKMQKRFRVKKLQRSHARKTQVRRHIHRHHKNKSQRSQKKVPKSGKNPEAAIVNHQRNSEVNFIEPYHNDRPQRQTSQSGSDSRLQRIWRRFQIAN
ncbi:transcription initiation factor TFIID subunit 1 [Drosophila kikkawai]|uniref:Transcription initiation factor TFIID subunit 1 n=1 Tax=Drosophila kikkawai TaxID=30033 RepID=A0A6P4J3Y6_DROKI|nr:DNA topoisomerase 1 [Drosophila kikkawai]